MIPYGNTPTGRYTGIVFKPFIAISGSTADEDTAITLDTIGSDYNTYIAVWTKVSGSLNLIACNDDIDFANGIVQSELTMRVQNGVTYFIGIGEWAGDLSTSATSSVQTKKTFP